MKQIIPHVPSLSKGAKALPGEIAESVKRLRKLLCCTSFISYARFNLLKINPYEIARRKVSHSKIKPPQVGNGFE